MKTKKIFPVIAAILCISAFSGCTSGSNTAEFHPYWHYDVRTPDFSIDETLVYDVTFEKDVGMDQVGYGLDYSGTYTTHLKGKGTDKYEYSTSLAVTVTYTLDGKDYKYDDLVKSTVIFKDTNNGLRPISSTKQICSYTPLPVSNPDSVEQCFVKTEVDYTILYGETENDAVCTGSKTITMAGADPVTTEIDQDFSFSMKSAYVDNEQVLFAIRGISDDESSASMQTYSPFAQAKQKIKVSFEESDTAASMKVMVNNEEKTSFNYRTASISLDQKNPGATQTAKYAIPQDVNSNVNRNMMLQLETPLSYSMGILKYTLTTVTRSGN